MTQSFAAGQEQWRSRLGTLRQVVRQEMVSRQVAAHVPDRPARRVLDLGCGQGTQVVALARRGHQVTGLDTSPILLADLRRALNAEPQSVRERVCIIEADVEEVGPLLGPSAFDVVLCHGVLMYFADPRPVIRSIAQALAPDGVASVLVRNADALALRPALLGDWDTARAALRSAVDTAYVNRIGVRARADRLTELTAALQDEGLTVAAHYGVQVFTDVVPGDAPPPDRAELDVILDCEEEAGRTDPYRSVAALTHLIARAAPEGGSE